MALKPEWKKFIREMNKHGDAIEAYLKAYPKATSRKSAATSAERLLKKAEIQRLLKSNPEIQQKAMEKAIEELKEELKFEVLESAKKRQILYDIATGVHKPKEYFTKKDGTVGSYSRDSSPVEIMRAIEIDNRMAGDDAPQKHDHTVKTDIADIYKQALQLKNALKDQGKSDKK